MKDPQKKENDPRTHLKICGLTLLEDARFAAGALADYLGFIFYPESPRYIEPAKAGAIINWIEGSKTIGVFVNQALDDVNQISTQTGIEYVQLHGTESPEYCKLIDRPVIKVFHLDETISAEELNRQIDPYLPHVEFLLFDKKSSDLWGGTGKTFDWEVLKKARLEKPFFLAGGLNPENIRQAFQDVGPFAFDVNSGVEKAPGIKDFDKIEELLEEMRVLWELQEQAGM